MMERPNNEHQAKLVSAQSQLFTLIDDILYYVDHKLQDVKRCVVPVHLRDGRVSQQPNGWTLLCSKAVQINDKQLVVAGYVQ